MLLCTLVATTKLVCECAIGLCQLPVNHGQQSQSMQRLHELSRHVQPCEWSGTCSGHSLCLMLVSCAQMLAIALQSRVSEVLHVDIHPAAQLGSGVLIDHATGVVIGETAVVGNNVSMLHHVTLGGSGTGKGIRHPTIGTVFHFCKLHASQCAFLPADLLCHATSVLHDLRISMGVLCPAIWQQMYDRRVMLGAISWFVPLT